MKFTRLSKGTITVKAKNEKEALERIKRLDGDVKMDSTEITLNPLDEQAKASAEVESHGWELIEDGKCWHKVINGDSYHIELTKKPLGEPQYKIGGFLGREFYTLAETKQFAEDLANKKES